MKVKISFKRIFVVLGIVFFIFVLLFIWEIKVEDYCVMVAQKVIETEGQQNVEPTQREKSRGLTFQSNSYRAKRECEVKYFPLWRILDPL